MSSGFELKIFLDLLGMLGEIPWSLYDLFGVGSWKKGRGVELQGRACCVHAGHPNFNQDLADTWVGRDNVNN